MAEKKLGFIARQSFRSPLERRHDYLLEVIATWGTRKRILDEIIDELETHLSTLSDNDEKCCDFSQRLARYRSISEQCLKWINWAVKTSEECLKEGQCSQEEHNEILDWAEPFITKGVELHDEKESQEEGQEEGQEESRQEESQEEAQEEGQEDGHKLVDVQSIAYSRELKVSGMLCRRALINYLF